MLHGRDPQGARAAAARVAQDTGSPRVRPVFADFSQLSRVRALAQELAATLPRLDVLVNNAGMMSPAHARSAEGYDLTFAVNHLAPFLLTNLLLPKLRGVRAGAHRGRGFGRAPAREPRFRRPDERQGLGAVAGVLALQAGQHSLHARPGAAAGRQRRDRELTAPGTGAQPSVPRRAAVDAAC